MRQYYVNLLLRINEAKRELDPPLDHVAHDAALARPAASLPVLCSNRAKTTCRRSVIGPLQTARHIDARLIGAGSDEEDDLPASRRRKPTMHSDAPDSLVSKGSPQLRCCSLQSLRSGIPQHAARAQAAPEAVRLGVERGRRAPGSCMRVRGPAKGHPPQISEKLFPSANWAIGVTVPVISLPLTHLQSCTCLANLPTIHSLTLAPNLTACCRPMFALLLTTAAGSLHAAS